MITQTSGPTVQYIQTSQPNQYTQYIQTSQPNQPIASQGQPMYYPAPGQPMMMQPVAMYSQPMPMQGQPGAQMTMAGQPMAAGYMQQPGSQTNVAYSADPSFQKDAPPPYAN